MTETDYIGNGVVGYSDAIESPDSPVSEISTT